MESEILRIDMKKLFEAILTLKSVTECQKFFRDVCTLKEMNALAERWKIVNLLNQKKSYRQVAKETGVSTTTIGRVAHWLHHGEGGYRLVLDRMKKNK